jgi:hypothetical protein
MMPRKKKVAEDEVNWQKLEEDRQLKEELLKEHLEKTPTITSITIAHTGTFFGLADNKIYVYEGKGKWRLL